MASSLQIVIVLSPLQVDPEPVHGGKHDDHHAGGDGAASWAQVTFSRSCWQDSERSSALNKPWHIETV